MTAILRQSDIGVPIVADRLTRPRRKLVKSRSERAFLGIDVHRDQHEYQCDRNFHGFCPIQSGFPFGRC